MANGASVGFTFRYYVTGGMDCNNGTFGHPISGVDKTRHTKDSGSRGGYNPNAGQIALFVDANYGGRCMVI